MCARGTPLRAGELILTGALGPMQALAPGDTVSASFGELGDLLVVDHYGTQRNVTSQRSVKSRRGVPLPDQEWPLNILCRV
ncbi:MAG: hypothetical protein F4011_05010 [Acidimicrobiaceae bacterium]|nr:hypothetical protein [Acidimicrobiaceae bacterium]MYH00903.1 hypothetical protein [Acidimicrobiaceae bacterium]MYL03525.1 hypothetical protein [Acidimicrobiaceae bacterium]